MFIIAYIPTKHLLFLLLLLLLVNLDELLHPSLPEEEFDIRGLAINNT